MNTVTLHHGDCLDVLRTLPDNSIDAVVTDPPYELAFMGRQWDATGIAYNVDLWRECLRVLKPGGHLLAFGGTRTYHRMACAVEDAGFEIRDSITWLYGSGFPKSLDVSKAIDKRPGVALHREFAADLRAAMTARGYTNTFDVAEQVVGRRTGAVANWQKYQFPRAKWWPALRDLLGMDEEKWGPVIAEAERDVVGQGHRVRRESVVQIAGLSAGAFDITAPATDAAKQWSGWGTALKPASEPIIVARKPLSGTVAATVQAHGTGAMNIDGCRVGTTVETWPVSRGPNTGGSMSGGVMAQRDTGAAPAGRWPSNVVLTHGEQCTDVCEHGCPVAELDAQSGNVGAAAPVRGTEPSAAVEVGTITGKRARVAGAFHADSGGASRFFATFRYQAKAPARERPKVDGVAHPTVKPLALMAWLVRLVCPPGGTVLDPFAGSGTTLQAARDEGMAAVGIEREAAYLPLIAHRVGGDMIVEAGGGSAA